MQHWCCSVLSDSGKRASIFINNGGTVIIFTLLVTVWKETPGDDMLITIHQVRCKLVDPRCDVRSLGMRFWVGIVGIRYSIDISAGLLVQLRIEPIL